MPLPTISTPTYELTLPSSERKIKFRPFLVKEEKILILAMESQDSKQIATAVKDVLKKCILTRGTKVEKLSTFDIEYLFLNIRGKSVGEDIEVMVTCPDDKKTYADIEVNLEEVQVQVDDDHTNKIELTNDMGIIMTYPTIDSFKDTGIQQVNASNMIDIISSCILQIYENKGEKVYEAKDQTQKELTDFIEQMNTEQFKKVQKFFDTMPKLKHKVKVKNPKTKKNSEVELVGLNDFFA